MDCPNCKATSGMPFKASTSVQTKAIEVSMRCRGCWYEWRFAMPILGNETPVSEIE